MQDINVVELKEKLQNKEGFILLDVREPFEREEFNIGGEFAPLQTELMNKINEWKAEDKQNAEIVVYCRSGMRSGKAKLILEQEGFKNVRNLLGGMLEWRAKIIS
jgi:rhodanese-related sulfurtransferase